MSSAVSQLQTHVTTRSQRVSHTGEVNVGFVLTDQDLRPVYADRYSLQVLLYPHAESGNADTSAAEVQRQLKRVLGAHGRSADLRVAKSFLSGRRRYVCRCFQLQSWSTGELPAIGFLFERQGRAWSVALVETGRRFNLSQREAETVRHLVHGLTTKEIASRMNVSPNTVKQFVRFVMTKMGATTRAGVLGRIFSN